MEVIDHDDEGSDDANIDLSHDEENSNIIDEDDSDDN